MTKRQQIVSASSAYNVSADLRRKALAVAVGAAFAQGAYALPQGGQAQVGSMVITTPTQSSMVITHSTTQNVAGFNSFNTTAGETVRVNFTNGGSAFYRVADPVSFYGSLSANGKIFLSSPGGVLFGAGSLVDVGSIVATTLSMTNADYLANRFVFTNQGATGDVVNQGTILVPTGGYAALIGPRVSNDGIIIAQMGTVALAAGNKVTLDMIGDGLVKVVVDEAALNASVMNKGTLQADGGNVLLTARSANALLDTVINTEGVIRANTLSERNGVIVLDGGDNGVVSVSGTVSAQGLETVASTGGTVKALGNMVGVGLNNATANISVAGNAGGGTALIGGNFQGKGPEKNAQRTFVGKNAIIDASALITGNGGRAIIWADNSTQFYGTLNARGGSLGGNGGFAEISGKQTLDLHGTVDLGASLGEGGSLLLDPAILTIQDAAGTLNAPVAFADAANSDVATVGIASIIAGTTTLQAGQIRFNNTGDIVMAAGSSLTLTVDNTQVGANLGTGNNSITNLLNAAFNITTTGAGTITMNAGGAINLNNITLNSESAVSLTAGTTLALGSVATTTGGTLSATAGGTITQSSGTLSVAGLTTLTAGANAITLGNANNFSTVSVVSATNASINDTNAIDLGATTVTGNLTVTAAGAITQSGNLTVPGTASLAAGGANNITLAGTNNFGTVSIVSGNNVQINDTNSIDLGASTISGTFNLTAAGGITDSGALAVTGATTLTAGANAITLNNANNFSTVSVVSATDAAFNDTNGIDLGATTVTGNLTVTANGAITQSGALTVPGTAQFAAGAANNITLAGANNFGTVQIVNGNNVQVNDTSALDIASSTVSGSFNVTAAGAITDSGDSTLNGVTTLTAGANAITLNNSNNFATVSVVSATDVLLNEGFNAIDLGAMTASGTLNVTAAAGITSSGALAIGGNATFSAGNGQSIALTNASNNFGGSVGFISGGTLANVSVVDTTALDLAALTITGNLTATANGITQSGALAVPGTASFTNGAGNNLDLSTAGNNFGTVSVVSANNVLLVDSSALVLGASTISGTFNVTAAGAITDSGALAVTNATTLTAGANAITLDAANNFSTVSVVSATNATFNDTNGIVLGATTVTGNLTVTAAGTITQSGNITVPGTASLAAGGANNITLAGTNNFGTVSIVSGNDVQVNDTDGVDLGASTISGTFNLTAAGAITDSGALAVTNATTLTAGANAITLDAGNNFSTVSIVSATSATINDTSGIDLGTSSVTTNLTVTANGAITQSGNITVPGTASFAAGAANNITLAGANNFGTASIVSGNDVQLNDTNALDLGASTVSGTLTVTAGGAITDSAALTVAGVTTLTAGANAITLDNANNFSTVSVVSASNVVLNEGFNAIDLGAMTASGTLNVTSGAGIPNSGALLIGGNSTFTAANGSSIALTNASNNFGGSVTFASGGTLADVLVVDTTALDLGALTITGNLTVTAAGITQSGALVVPGTATFTAGGGNNITLAGANNFGTASIVSGNNVQLNDTNALDLGASTVSGTLTVTAAGPITDSGVLAVTNATTLTAGANAITLDAANNFSTVSVVSASNAAFNDTTGIVLGATTVTGNLAVTAGGTITQSGNITVPGTATLTAGANAITLAGTNNFGTVSVVSGANVQLNDTDAIDLGASTITGTLAVTAAGAITDSGALAVTNATTLTAGANAITLDAGNNFSTVSVVSASNATINDTNGIVLGASTVTGNLTITANGAITQSGALVVPGTASFAAGGGNNITLAGANNFGTASIVSGNDVQLNDTSAVDFGTSAISGAFNVTAAGAISDSGALTVAGVTTLTAGANAITLDNANNFSTVSVVSASNVVLNDTNAIDLGAMTASGTLNVTSGAGIPNSGALLIGGNSTFTAANGSSIALTNASNNFGGSVTFASGGTLADVLVVDTTALDLGALTITGNLTVTAAGITQSGALVVPGTATFTAGGGNNITLAGANNFGTASIVSGNNVQLNDTNALDLGASTVSGTLTVTAAGPITDSGVLAVTNATTLTAGANAITLDAANNFSTVSVVSASNAAFNDTTGIVLGATTVTGNLAVTAGGTITQSGNITVPGTATLTAGANAITLAGTNNFGTVSVVSASNAAINDTDAIDLGASTVTGNLTITANGAITQSGALVVPGTASFAAGGGNNITLAGANNFGTASIVSGNDVQLNDTNALELGASTVSGTLTVTAGGAITDSAALTVAGVTTLTAGANAITLDAGNNFSTVSVVSASNATINDTNGIVLGASTVTGNLTITANGAITQSGALVVPGTASFAAGGGNNITLAGANNFGTASIVSGNDVQLNDTNALELGASTVSGTLTVTAGGAITDSAVLTVAGVTTLTAGANAITLDAGNNFSTVSVVSASNAAFNDTTGIVLGATTVTGNLAVTAGGTITQSGNITVPGTATLTAGANAITLAGTNNFGTVSVVSASNVALNDTNAIDLGASTVTGNYNVTAAGAITQSGALVVPGTASFAAGGGNNITLAGANNFGTASIVSGNDVQLNDTNALELGASTVSGTLTVTAGGAITDSAALTVAGVTTLTAGANAITLDAGNNFSTVSVVSASNATINDTNGIVLGASTVTGNLTITANGAITQSGALVVPGTASFAAGGGNNITLAGANNFGTASIVSGNDVQLNDTNALELGASTVSGTLTVTAGGAITDSAALTVAGVTTLTAGANAITLDAGNNFSTVSVVSASNATINDTNGIVLGASTVTGNLTITANGAITQSGALVVPGTASFAAGGGNNITLAGANNFGTASIVSGNDVQLNDTNALDLGASTVSGTLTVTAGGAITDSAALTVAGVTTLTAGANAITLDAGNNFSTVSVVSASNATINDTTGIVLGATTVTGNLAVTAGGTITQSGNITVPGTATLTAGANAITLAGTNNFGTVSVVSASNVALNDTNAIDLGASTVTGNYNVTAAGAITQSGALTVPGTSSFTAGANAITLTSANDFTGAVTLSNTAGAVQITDANTITLAAGLNLGGAFTVNAGGLITSAGITNTGNQTYNNAVSLNGTYATGGGAFSVGANATTLAGNTTVNAGAGGITFNGVTGAFSLAANSTTNETFGTVNIGSISTDAPGTVTLNGNVTTTGSQTFLDAVTAAGRTFTSTGGGTITATNAANDFTGTTTVSTTGTVSLRDVNALTLTSAGPLTLGAMTVGGAFTVSTTNAGAALNLGSGTVGGALAATSNNGAITQTGGITVTGTSNIQSGTGSITLTSGNDFVGGVTAGGNGISLTDVNSITPTSIVSTGAYTITAGGQIGGGVISGTGGTLSAGTNNVAQNLLVTTTLNPVLFTGGATSWNLQGGSVLNPLIQVGNTGITVLVANAAQVTSLGGQTAQISASAAQNSASAAAADEAANTFGTDSVAEQIEYGFAGDVGTLPPIDHRLQGVGISVPKCFNESREGDGC